ncbi:MAG: 16S rRNA (cytosine(1402)-N(4))-methyltransferase RsmH [Bacteroidetes bacterium]|nr:16S rRNA (cytosine(1402)-N(4))-methyltransferase RsmH [Bacteroidota bacterium]
MPNQPIDSTASQAFASSYHIPVLFHETMEYLNIQPEGIYVDATFGGGGHSKGILAQLGPKGRLIAFDQDADAKNNLPKDERLLFIPENFKYLQRFLRLHQITQVDGVLADLGVSSHQFDEGSRGFSTRYDGPFDMRMDQRGATTASHVIESFSEAELHKMFEQYGEVTNSKTLAKHIATQRKHVKLNTVQDFKTFIAPVVKGNPNKYWAQVFQAIRIVVNEEMEVLKEFLAQLPLVIKPGGRAVIITFHSIEDRLVKNAFRVSQEEEKDAHPFLSPEREVFWKIITKKPVMASEKEMNQNNRSRSAKLRAAERL